jgi:nucleotide-binding universal stress UspA family protein
MFEAIIVPLDGSELAEAALAPAAELQRKLGSQLILVRAVESESQVLAQTPTFFESPAGAAANIELLQDVVEAERKEASEYLDAAIQKLGASNAIKDIRTGRAADAIIAVANEKPGALIVMSSHGRGGLGRLVFGSVADAVLKDSDIPVLLIRTKAES